MFNLETEEYNEDMGQINLPDEVKEKLKGLPLEEQCKFFRIENSEHSEEYSYGEEEGSDDSQWTSTFEKCSYFRSIILKDGIIVGVRFRGGCGFLDKWVCVYFAVDNDGTGSESVSVYCRLVLR